MPESVESSDPQALEPEWGAEISTRKTKPGISGPRRGIYTQ
jgi:hypothetical protein